MICSLFDWPARRTSGPKTARFTPAMATDDVGDERAVSQDDRPGRSFPCLFLASGAASSLAATYGFRSSIRTGRRRVGLTANNLLVRVEDPADLRLGSGGTPRTWR